MPCAGLYQVRVDRGLGECRSLVVEPLICNSLRLSFVNVTRPLRIRYCNSFLTDKGIECNSID